jgi:hypothetical protein
MLSQLSLLLCQSFGGREKFGAINKTNVAWIASKILRFGVVEYWSDGVLVSRL